MAIDKVEGVFGQMIVIFYQDNWYGIPMSQLVNVDACRQHYGLVVTAENLVDNDIVPFQPFIKPTPEQEQKDRVVLLSLRWARMGNEAVPDLKALIARHPDQFAGILAADLIP